MFRNQFNLEYTIIEVGTWSKLIEEYRTTIRIFESIMCACALHTFIIYWVMGISKRTHTHTHHASCCVHIQKSNSQSITVLDFVVGTAVAFTATIVIATMLLYNGKVLFEIAINSPSSPPPHFAIEKSSKN